MKARKGPPGVALVGMGCTRFGERWDASLDDLISQAWSEALESASMTQEDVDGYWFGSLTSSSGLTLSRAVPTLGRPITRVENYCATGSDALRNAAYAVQSGEVDVAMAIGAEKLKDTRQTGLAGTPVPGDGTVVVPSAPSKFALLADGYAQAAGLSEEDLRSVLTAVARKNHANGALNERAHFRSPVSVSAVEQSPVVAGALRVLDCSGVSDGAAAALLVPAERAHEYTDRPVFLQGLAMTTGSGRGAVAPDYDYASLPEVEASAAAAYERAGIVDPRSQIAVAEVHDCFTITEVVLAEALGFAPRWEAWKEYLEGNFEIGQQVAINPDGGLKAFGHPIGASGLRMLFECWKQLRGEAGERQADTAGRYGLVQNLGGGPGECLSIISVWSAEQNPARQEP